jgi:hypothetical protein
MKTSRILVLLPRSVLKRISRDAKRRRLHPLCLRVVTPPESD